MKPELVSEERLKELLWRQYCLDCGRRLAGSTTCEGCVARNDFFATARAVLKELGVDRVIELDKLKHREVCPVCDGRGGWFEKPMPEGDILVRAPKDA